MALGSTGHGVGQYRTLPRSIGTWSVKAFRATESSLWSMSAGTSMLVAQCVGGRRQIVLKSIADIAAYAMPVPDMV
eukprot:3520217-Rhodomonas_salina.2